MFATPVNVSGIYVAIHRPFYRLILLCHTKLKLLCGASPHKSASYCIENSKTTPILRLTQRQFKKGLKPIFSDTYLPPIDWKNKHLLPKLVLHKCDQEDSIFVMMKRFS